jgi:hypothetical protein
MDNFWPFLHLQLLRRKNSHELLDPEKSSRKNVKPLKQNFLCRKTGMLLLMKIVTKHSEIFGGNNG